MSRYEFEANSDAAPRDGASAGRAAVSSVEVLELLVQDDSDLGWQSKATCPQTDPEAFFPEKNSLAREAKKVCANCEVRTECLEYALKNDERFGVWGGLTERERRKLKKRSTD